jgi:formylmethanofuran dehydrogenase subunit E
MRKASIIGLGDIFKGDFGVGCYIIEAFEQERLNDSIQLAYLAEDPRYAGDLLYEMNFVVIVGALNIEGAPGMNKTEALRSIRYDLLEYIQKRVRVDFDNIMQMPVCFTFRGRKHLVHEILGRFRTHEKHHINGFLINTDENEAYFLYFQLWDMERQGPFHSGFWVLSFRVLKDRELMAFYREDRKMLVNMTLKNVVDFHGHLCPELVIGVRVCEYAQKLFSENRKLDNGISIVAENCTSALDAIQILLGATVGNQRLKVMDFGKHNYTFSCNNRQNGFRLSLKQQHYGDEDEYRWLEGRIENEQVTLDEVVYFQKLLDRRVKQLFASPLEDLFDMECIEPILKSTEMATIYLSCCKCEQQILRSRAVDFEGKIFCIPCFQRMNTGCIYHSLQ